MNCLILKQCNLIFLCVLFFQAFICSINEFQDMKPTTGSIDFMIKNMEEEANQVLEKRKACNDANITNLITSEDNDIKVEFKLTDQKFEDCFKYFNISLRKRNRIIKQEYATFIHDKLRMVSFRFKNIPCGIYEVFVQPCFTLLSCLEFDWTYAKSINVTSEICSKSLPVRERLEQKVTEKLVIVRKREKEIVRDTVKSTSGEKESSNILIISSITVFLILLMSFLLAAYCRNYDVTRNEYVTIAINEENRTNVKPFNIYILFFKDYDDEAIQAKIIKNVEALKNILQLLLNCLLDRTMQREREFPFFINVKLVECMLSEILLNKKLESFLKRQDILPDGCDILKKIILVDPKRKKGDEDIVENIIFSDIKEILQSGCIVIRLATTSRELDRDCLMIPDDLIDLCYNLCSCCGCGTLEIQGRLQTLLTHRINEGLDLVQLHHFLKETVHHNGRVLNTNCRNFSRRLLPKCPCN